MDKAEHWDKFNIHFNSVLAIMVVKTRVALKRIKGQSTIFFYNFAHYGCWIGGSNL